MLPDAHCARACLLGRDEALPAGQDHTVPTSSIAETGFAMIMPKSSIAEPGYFMSCRAVPHQALAHNALPCHMEEATHAWHNPTFITHAQQLSNLLASELLLSREVKYS